MRAHVDLKLEPDERIALRALNEEEREAVIEELLAQVREELEWMVARAAADELPIAVPSVEVREISAVPVASTRPLSRMRPPPLPPPRRPGERNRHQARR
jgi:hypothetical protein